VSLQLVPVNSSPRQQFAAALTVDGNPLTLNLALNYNEMAGLWMMSISDVNSNLLIDSIPLVTGGYPAANLLQQQRYLAIGSAFIINVANTNGVGASVGFSFGQGGFGQGPYGGGVGFNGVDYPDDTNLGQSFQLWWGDTPSV
jgi:hypothetical protein